MKKAMAHLKLGAKSTGEQRKKPLLPMKVIAIIFEEYRMIYKGLWTSGMETEEQVQMAMKIWARRLSSCTGEQIAHGLKTWEGEYPPTVMAFKALCKAADKIPAHQPYIALPKPEPDRKLAARAIEEIRKCLTN